MIQWMLAIWSLIPLPFLNPAWTSGNSQFMYCWSLLAFNDFKVLKKKNKLTWGWWFLHYYSSPFPGLPTPLPYVCFWELLLSKPSAPRFLSQGLFFRKPKIRHCLKLHGYTLVKVKSLWVNQGDEAKKIFLSFHLEVSLPILIIWQLWGYLFLFPQLAAIPSWDAMSACIPRL